MTRAKSFDLFRLIFDFCYSLPLSGDIETRTNFSLRAESAREVARASTRFFRPKVWQERGLGEEERGEEGKMESEAELDPLQSGNPNEPQET